MRRILVLTVAMAVMLGLAAPAGATPPSDVQIVNPITDVFSDTSRFTTSNDILCPEGDVMGVHFKAAGNGNNGVNFQIVKKFTCDNESGEFFVKLQVRLSFDTFTTTFNWNVVGGTDAYVDLHGSGSGFSTSCGVDCITDFYDGTLHIDP